MCVWGGGRQAGVELAPCTHTPPSPRTSTPPPLTHPQALAHVGYEESKYLGGDVAHTHLVKGLDYALLAKAGGGSLCGWVGG